MNNNERFRDEAHEKISGRQTAKQEFSRWMKGSLLVKGDQDESVAKKRCKRKENVEHYKACQLAVYPSG